MSILHEKLTEEVEQFTPIKTYCVNSKKARREPWLTSGIHISIRKSKRLYNMTLHNKADFNSLNRYKCYAKTPRRVKRHVKLVYYENKCRMYKHNIKRLWGIINEICATHNHKSSLVDCLRINNILEYYTSKITNRFGEYFSKVGKEFANKVAKSKNSAMHYCKLIPGNEKTLFMTPCTELEIAKLIGQLP